jgi:hypothetical protein
MTIPNVYAREQFIIAALTEMCPKGTNWKLDNFTDLTWGDNGDWTPPSLDVIKYRAEQLYNEHVLQNYARKRMAEYPSIGDQLDALWKGGDAAEKMLAQVQAVKNKYPKPE